MILRRLTAALGATALAFSAGCSSCHKQTCAAPPCPPPRVAAAPPCCGAPAPCGAPGVAVPAGAPAAVAVPAVPAVPVPATESSFPNQPPVSIPSYVPPPPGPVGGR
jgi:hypothetical protein